MKKVISLITSASLLITPALATYEVQNTKLLKNENQFALTQHSLSTIVQGAIVSAAIINEVIAVIISKYAFMWAGEIKQS